MNTAHAAVPNNENAAYGYGVFVGTAPVGDQRVTFVQHGGGINGFTTSFWRLTDRDAVIALSSNTQDGSEGMAADIAALGVPDEMAERFWNTVRENIDTRAGIAEWWTLFCDGATPQLADEDREFVAQAFEMLPPLPYGPETWGDWTAAVKEATGRKGRGLFMPLRHAVTGRQRGPEMADVMPLLQVKPKI